MPVFCNFSQGPKLDNIQQIDVVSFSTTDGVIFGSSLPAISRRFGRLLWLLSVTLLLSSILSGCASLVLGSPATSLQFSPTTIDFGDVDVGAAATSLVSLSNQSTASTNIAGLAVSGKGFALQDKVTFPLTLGGGSSKGVSVDFAPTSEGDFTGELSAIDSLNHPLATVRVRGHGRRQSSHRLTVTPTIVDFGNVSVNSTATQPVTLAATGTGSVTIDSVVLSDASFTVSGVTFPLTLQAGQSKVLNVTFKPTAAAISSGELSIKSNSEDSSTATVHLTGAGVVVASVPQLTVSATSLSFGNVTVNSSATKTITLTSTGTGSITVKGVGVAGTGYALAGGTFPVSLNPGASLTWQVAFDPKTTGASAGSLNISSNANATTTVSLSGIGVATSVPQLTVSATSLSFGNVTVKTNMPKTVTLTSTGTGPVTLTGVSVSGSGFSAAAIAVPLKLNPGQTLNLQITFTPTATGAATGSLILTSDSSPNATTKVPLIGTGVSAVNPMLTVSATTLDFGSIAVGLPVTQVLTLTSTGNAAVTVSKVSVTGSGFTISGLTFPVTLNPTIAVKLTVLFTPAAAGTSTGQLTIASNSSSGSTALVSLNGSATATQHSVDLTWSAPANSPDPVLSYKIYRAATSGSFTVLNASAIAQTSYVDQSVQSGTTYTYYVTSVDASGTESAPSNEIGLTVP